MSYIDIILIIILIVILGLAGKSIIKNKRSGRGCSSCPYAGNCDKACSKAKGDKDDC